MSRGRLRMEWDRTAALVAKIHNVNCQNSGQMIKDPSVLNPYRQRAKARMPLKQVRRLMEGRGVRRQESGGGQG